MRNYNTGKSNFDNIFKPFVFMLLYCKFKYTNLLVSIVLLYNNSFTP